MSRSPILRDIPTQIETARLLIRCPQPGDGVAVHAGVVEALQALRAFPASLPWAMAEPSLAASETYCREGQAKYQLRTELPMLIFLKQGQVYLGGTGLHGLDWAIPKCETGYWLRPSHWGQGLAVEAVSAIVDLAMNILGMRRIEALPDDENLPSCRVCERAAFQLEGVHRHDRIEAGGSLRSTRVYAITRRDDGHGSSEICVSTSDRVSGTVTTRGEGRNVAPAHAGGWYGLKKVLRGRFGVYAPPLMEALGLCELEHQSKNHRMRAR